MNPEEIASKDFPVVMRGYVREEVHAFLAAVASQVAERDARLAELEAQLNGLREAQRTSSPSPSSAPVIDRGMLLRQLGEEAASILACADASAERLRAQANMATERVRHDLRSIGSSLVDVHQLLGELVSLVQGLADSAPLVEPEPAEVNLADASAQTETGSTAEVRTVLGEVLGLDGGDQEEIHLTEEGQGVNPVT